MAAVSWWLAVVLAVGTMLILFIAWGFRCSDDDTQLDSQIDDSAAQQHHTPLMRERAEPVAAPRGTTQDSTASVDSNAPVPNRLCCVCQAKKISVVVIPCGHACMCRKCSFAASKCPVCAGSIQAQQRFFW